MDTAQTVVLAYSLQLLVVVGAAAVAEAFVPAMGGRLRFAYWRGVGICCLLLPLFATTVPGPPIAEVVFDAAIEEPAVSSAAAVGRAWHVVVSWILVTGIAARLAWLAIGAWRLRQLRKEATPVDLDADLHGLHAELAPGTALYVSGALRQPAGFGLRRPAVLLPAAFFGLTAEARRAVLCHELLHVARCDWPWIVVEEIVRAFFWFHPAVWWLVDRIQLGREQLVDRLVVDRLPAKRVYMSALLTFSEARRFAAPATAFLRRHHLRARLRQLIEESVMSPRRRQWTMLGLTAAVGLSMAGVVRVLPVEVPAMAQVPTSSRLEVRLAEPALAPGLIEVEMPGADARVYLHATPLVTADDVVSARMAGGAPGYSVVVQFASDSSARLSAATAGHIGRPVAILLDGRVVAAPTVRSAIGESATITGLTLEEARRLARELGQTPPPGVADGQAPDVTLPRVIREVKPYYTPDAMQAGIEGSVGLSGVVRTDGTIDDIEVVRSLDTEHGLDEQAVAALAQWRFEPGRKNGDPVAVRVDVEMTFTLRK